jgi:Asp-tRNA(Asn)/Glu-tRNA(Gln) amidotransferase A subunit family amidase
MTDRRTFLSLCTTAGFSLTMAEALWTQAGAMSVAGGEGPAAQARPRITREMVRAAEAIAGARYSDAERDLMLESLESNLTAYEHIRLVRIPNALPPALQFAPLLPGSTPAGAPRKAGARPHSRPSVRRPATNGDIAYLSVLELAELIRSRQLSSMELTRIYLERLRRHNPQLRCVVNLTPERALQRAAEADRQIAAGRYRGPLHGIPYGVKDILAVPEYPTTWGAAVYRDRVLNQTATVVERLDEAGAVLVAKLALGELGLSDAWFGGRTMNPWRPSVGAAGSSAGSAAAVAAGLVGFAIGAETMGSIVTPATRNGVTGLRPTFGRVSRHGAMTLSWSLDKLGPMARAVEDCAVVLEAIAGPDGKDPTVARVPYAWDPDRGLAGLRVGYFRAAFEAPHSGKTRDDAALESLRRLGVRPIPVDLPADLPVNSLLIIRVEAAAALDEVARDHGLELLAVQDATGWPNFIRSSRFVPAVDYVQANRIRTMLMQRLEAVFESVDVFIAPSFGVMPITNLTGHPCVVVPNGLTQDGVPASISFIGRLYGEAELCAAAKAWQDATGFHKARPAAFAD